MKTSIFTGSSNRLQMAIKVRVEERQILTNFAKSWQDRQTAMLEAAKKFQQEQEKSEEKEEL